MPVAEAGEFIHDLVQQVVVAVERNGAEDLGARPPASKDVCLEGVLLG